MSKLAFGCSHTFGVGVEPHEAWPALLDAINYGVSGCSSDLIARIMPALLAKHTPVTVYVLWPEWSRFEIQTGTSYKQSLVTDSDRIYYMEHATDNWLHTNFTTQQKLVRTMCNNIHLVELTLDDLIPYMDHADQWPLSKLGHHYDHTWHQQVADIFNAK
jgi:hypothetical protein